MSDLPSTTPMAFSATSACARCWVRFPSRKTCPACGSAEVLSLRNEADRQEYLARACTDDGPGEAWRRFSTPGPGETPARIWGPIVACLALVFGPSLVVMRHASARAPRDVDDPLLEGLSAADFMLLLVATFGAVMLVVVVAARLKRTARTHPAATDTAGPRLRVHHAARENGPDRTSLRGRARRATLEIPAALSGQTCLVFGVLGAVGGTDVADAEGGDFDLELETGERVMVSLEHALLLAAPAASAGEPRAPVEAISDVLGQLLASRAIAAAAPAEGTAAQPVLEEHVLRDGDDVTVTGTVLGGTVTSLPSPAYRGASRTRVIAGDAEHPLVVQLAAVAI